VGFGRVLSATFDVVLHKKRVNDNEIKTKNKGVSRPQYPK
jgi:hypothetical protein